MGLLYLLLYYYYYYYYNYDDDDDNNNNNNNINKDVMHLTLSPNSSTLDMPPHIVTVNAAAARSTACFCCDISINFFCYTFFFTILSV